MSYVLLICLFKRLTVFRFAFRPSDTISDQENVLWGVRIQRFYFDFYHVIGPIRAKAFLLRLRFQATTSCLKVFLRMFIVVDVLQKFLHCGIGKFAFLSASFVHGMHTWCRADQPAKMLSTPIRLTCEAFDHCSIINTKTLYARIYTNTLLLEQVPTSK